MVFNQLTQRLIASKTLVDAMELPEFIEAIPLGDVELRGEAAPIPFVALK